MLTLTVGCQSVVSTESIYIHQLSVLPKLPVHQIQVSTTTKNTKAQNQ